MCVDEVEQGDGGGDVVGGGVDADDGVAGAEEEAVDDGGGDAAGSSVGWLGWRRVERRPGRPRVVRKRVTTGILRGDGDEVLDAHEFGDGGGHFGREAGGKCGEGFGGGFVGEQPVAEFADGEVGDGGEGCGRRGCRG